MEFVREAEKKLLKLKDRISQRKEEEKLKQQEKNEELRMLKEEKEKADKERR